MIISIIPPDKIINHIATAKKYLSEAEHMLQPRGTVSDLIADCIAGTLVMWGVFDPDKIETDEDPLVAVLITRVTTFWRCNVLEYIALAGQRGLMRKYISLMDATTEAYAEATDCLLRVVPAGRPEWERYGRRFGFKSNGLVTLECPVGRRFRQ